MTEKAFFWSVSSSICLGCNLVVADQISAMDLIKTLGDGDIKIRAKSPCESLRSDLGFGFIAPFHSPSSARCESSGETRTNKSVDDKEEERR